MSRYLDRPVYGCDGLRAFRERICEIEEAPPPAGRGFSLQPPQLVEMLARFPEDTTRCFEHHAFDLLCPYASQEAKAEVLSRMLAEVVKAAAPPEAARIEASDWGRVRYAALYALCMLKRRDHDPQGYRDLLGEAEPWAGRRPTFQHLKAMMHLLDAGLDHIALARACAERARADPRLADHIGVQHHYAEVVAAEAEDAEDWWTRDRAEREARLSDAVRLAEAAIKEEPGYAKFLATSGRLRGLLDDFGGAVADLRKAIEQERGEWNSDARRTDYKVQLVMVYYQRQLSALAESFRGAKDRADEIRDEFRATAEETKVRHAEMLGFFAGVLALILAGMQQIFAPGDGRGSSGAGVKGGAAVPAMLEAVVQASAVLPMLGGTLLVAFGGLGYMLRQQSAGQAGGPAGAAVPANVHMVRMGAFLFAVGLTIPVLSQALPAWGFALLVVLALAVVSYHTSATARLFTTRAGGRGVVAWRGAARRVAPYVRTGRRAPTPPA